MIRELVKGWKDTMAYTGFRGPHAYDVMKDIESRPVANAYDVGARIAVVMVRADEKRIAQRRNERHAREGQS